MFLFSFVGVLSAFRINLEQMDPSKYKNVFTSTPCKTLYSQLKTDSVCSTKIKANSAIVAVPGQNSTSIAILPLTMESDTTIKLIRPPLLLNHGKNNIQDFEFCPYNERLIASATKSDCIVRIWEIPQHIDVSGSGDLVEIDAAATYLASHEKRIDSLKFHPICPGVLVTSSVDATIKVWDLEASQDMITLNSSNVAVTNMDFDRNGNIIVAGYSDSTINFFDPRGSKDAILSMDSKHQQSKGCMVKYLNPDPFFISSGFNSLNQREIKVWDTRNTHAPTESIVIPESGVGTLIPYWDTSLPILYMAARGESMRIFEFTGSLKFISLLKSEKLPMAVDLLPKAMCDSNKCEIGRFIRLGYGS